MENLKLTLWIPKIYVLLAFVATVYGQSKIANNLQLRRLSHERNYKYSSSSARSTTSEVKYTFSGVSGQFSKFPIWTPASKENSISSTKQPSATLSFEFKTMNPRSFLAYLDDGGDISYVFLTLLDGSLNLRYKFGNFKTVVLKCGSNLNDNRWHEIEVKRKFSSMTLVVDKNSTFGFTKRKRFFEFLPTTHTYFGGLPGTYRIQLLSLPIAYKRSKFVGYMRRIKMNGNPVTYVEKRGVSEESIDIPCSESRNPCANNGICSINYQNKAVCDCSRTNFTGKTCKERYDDAVATFRGSQWLSFDLSRRTVSSTADEITLSFRTQEPNGLLLHTGKSADYITLSLEEGAVILAVNLGSGAYQIAVQSDFGGFNDGKWHAVRVNRTLLQVDIVVDQAYIHNSYLQEDFTHLTLDDVIYVGGSPSTSSLPGAKINNNFIGCLKEVTYSNSKFRRIMISKWARDRDKRVAVHGNIDFACSDPPPSNPVHFLTSGSWLAIPIATDPRKGAIEFDFKTTEPNGLLLYANSTVSDSFAVELYNGSIFVVINLGSGTSRFKGATPGKIVDGKWHRLNVGRNGKNLTISLDGLLKHFQVPGPNRNLDIFEKIYLGGTTFGSDFHSVPLWTAPLHQGFIGCIRDFRKDGFNLNIQSLAKSSYTSSSSLPSKEITPYCNGFKKSQCSSTPCKNGGLCSEGMNRFICDCSNTSFMGTTCEEAAISARFDGSQVMNFPVDTTVQTEGEDISLRFKTPVRTGILFATTSNSSQDSLTIQLVKGQIQLQVNIGQGPDLLLGGSDLNDRQYHYVKVSRRGRIISLNVDGRRKGKTLFKMHGKLKFDVIHLGKIAASPQNNVINSSTTTMASQTSPFVGHLENVVFNSVHLIDRCASNTLPCNSNSLLGDTSNVVSFPVTFRGDDSFVVLPALQTNFSMDLYFSLKTTVKDGLLLYSAGGNGDYIAVEMVEGKIFYLFSIGRFEQVLSVPGANTVNDNNWHDVNIVRNKYSVHKLVVDGVPAFNKGPSKPMSPDLNGYLYIGGVGKSIIHGNSFPNNIASRVGFQGCMGNIDFNGKITNVNGLKKIRSNGAVTNECQGPSQLCSNTSCSNGGTCLQQWNDFICDCSMTTYVGKNCKTRSVTYRFGSSNGLLLYQWMDNFPSSRDDVFALGFSTTQRNAALIKVLGSTNYRTRDFIELKIVNGKLTLRYNMGGRMDVVLYEPTIISDGQYHRCLVKRSWMNASIVVDDYRERTHIQSGTARGRVEITQDRLPAYARPTVSRWLRNKEKAFGVFNSQSTILIGGLVDLDLFNGNENSANKRRLSISEPFHGQMAGFFYNEIKVFEMAADGDPQVTTIGAVELVDQSPIPLFTFPAFPKLTTTMSTSVTLSTTQSTQNVVQLNITGCKNEDIKLCANSSDPIDYLETTHPILKPTVTGANNDNQWGSSIKVDEKGRPSTKLVSEDFKSTSSPDDQTLVTENYLGSVPIVVGEASSLSLTMIIGIVASSVFCVLILLLVMYRCRNREALQNANKREVGHETNGTLPNKAKDLISSKNGNVIRKKPTVPNHDPDKEVFV